MNHAFGNGHTLADQSLPRTLQVLKQYELPATDANPLRSRAGRRGHAAGGSASAFAPTPSTDKGASRQHQSETPFRDFAPPPPHSY